MNNNKPLVSIIIPCYNSETYIKRCIKSIQEQNYSMLQIIIIDDGSSDNTLNICLSLAKEDSRIEVYHQSNSGVSTARNKGLDIAKGAYVIFVDSDDSLHANTLSQIISSDSQADITFYSSSFVYSNGEVKSYVLNDTYFNDIQNETISINRNFTDIEYFGYTWNKVFLNSIIQKFHIRFTPNLSHREDEVFTFEYYTHCRTLRTCSTIVYNYMIQKNSLTAQGSTSSQFLLYLNSIIPKVRKIKPFSFYKEEIQRIFYLCIYGAKLARREKNIKNHHQLIKIAYKLYLKEIRTNNIPIRKIYCHSSWVLFYLNVTLHYRK